MKKRFVVLMTNGYYEAANKKDATEFLHGNEGAIEVIRTQAQAGNYYHSRIKVVAAK